MRKEITRKTPPYPLLRFKEKQNACVSDQQLPPTRQNDCRPLSFPLAGGTVFQMDQAASPDQGILRHNRKHREDSDLDRHFHLCPRRHREENLETRSKSLHNAASAGCFSLILLRGSGFHFFLGLAMMEARNADSTGSSSWGNLSK